MELNRDHYLIIGLVLLFLGLQFRYVDSFTLTKESSQFVAKRLKMDQPSTPRPVTALLDISGPPPSKRIVKHPRWLGFSLISVGAVLVFQSLMMKKPGG